MRNLGKQYLGDAVYIKFDGSGFTLTTENGEHETNTIYLEQEVIEALKLYVKETLER